MDHKSKGVNVATGHFCMATSLYGYH